MLMVNGSGAPEYQRSQKILGLECVRSFVPALRQWLACIAGDDGNGFVLRYRHSLSAVLGMYLSIFVAIKTGLASLLVDRRHQVLTFVLLFLSSILYVLAVDRTVE
jgi:hypothetical protein